MKLNSTPPFFSSKYLILFLHLFGWALILTFPFLVNANNPHAPRTNLLLIAPISAIILFYLNYFIFVPKFLFRKKHLFFILLLIGGFLFIYLLNSFFFNLNIEKFEFTNQGIDHFNHNGPPWEKRGMPPGRDLRPLFSSLSIGLIVIGISTSLRFYEKIKRNDRLQIDIMNQHLNTELAFLKNQINPHFLFNSLNSIYALAYRKSDHTTEAILKLSEILRYILYDAKDDLVPLELEIKHINNYIELQKLRITQNTTVNLTINGNLHDLKIEPMLLIPFIENSFKYGINNVSKSSIDLDIKVEDHFLLFRIKNAIIRNYDIPADKHEKGLGIENTVRRLDLLYPEQYKLDIKNKNNFFIVELQLNLKEHELHPY